MYFLIIKINNFRGDISDISAKTASLVVIKLVAGVAVGDIEELKTRNGNTYSNFRTASTMSGMAKIIPS